MVIPSLSAENNSQNYLVQIVLEHYCNIKDIAFLIKKTLPQLDLPRLEYESEIRNLVLIAIKSLVVVRDEKIIDLLKKYQNEMVFFSNLTGKKSCPYIIIDIILPKQDIGKFYD